MLFVANFYGGTVGEYNATTGAAVKANFIPGLTYYPQKLAVSGNNFFVASDTGGWIGVYNAITGALVRPNFTTGLNSVAALAASGNNLFVANNTNTVGEYDATTGFAIKANLITTLPTSPGFPYPWTCGVG